MTDTQRAVLTIATVFAAVFACVAAYAQQVAPPLDIPCPNDEPCQVLVLSKTEIGILVQDNGILATAAQARNLDLGQFVSYFRQKIALAPAGKNAIATPVPPAKQPEAPAKNPEAGKK